MNPRSQTAGFNTVGFNRFIVVVHSALFASPRHRPLSWPSSTLGHRHSSSDHSTLHLLSHIAITISIACHGRLDHPSTTTSTARWLVLSRQPESPLVVKHPVSSLPPKPPVNRPPLPVVSRSHTVTSLVPSLFVRFVATRSRLSCSSENSPSSVSFVRLLKTLRLISDSSRPPLALFRRLPR